MKRRTRSGFSLIEMVIVILILGIIAAVAAPRMFDTAEQAEINTTRQQLAVLRNAIEMHRAQNGTYPANGELVTAMSDMLNGPFPQPTIGPVRGLTGVYYDTTTTSAPVVPSPDGKSGWAYKPHNGSLKLNLDPSGSDIGVDW
ncbi:MAG: prepilin-type N-terminal cleavage/methylation domain-containing protein [Planctomycetales bacterium]|nr:prepilin-type N-terminal cleavage/methylation domain-containing protein [Planctomycetales bacterium]